MTAACTDSRYRIRPDNDEHTQRMLAITVEGMVIAGAYRPVELNDWKVFVSKFVTDAIGVTQPHKVHSCSRADALHWVSLIATLYTRAAPT